MLHDFIAWIILQYDYLVEMAMEHKNFIKVVIVDLFAALNVKARSNDAIRIVEPTGSDNRIELALFCQHVIYILIILTGTAAFVVVFLGINSANHLLAFGFAAVLAFFLASLFAIRRAFLKRADIKKLWSDKQARRLANKCRINSDKVVISLRVTLSMVKVFTFFVLVNSLVI